MSNLIRKFMLILHCVDSPRYHTSEEIALKLAAKGESATVEEVKRLRAIVERAGVLTKTAGRHAGGLDSSSIKVRHKKCSGCVETPCAAVP